MDIMQIERVIGVGRYSEKRALNALSGIDISVTTCWHPAPPLLLQIETEAKIGRKMSEICALNQSVV